MSIPSFKVCFVGTAGVGKTSLLIRINQQKFDPNEVLPTTSMKSYTQTFNSTNGSAIQIVFWDTAGQERFKSLGSLYYQNASVCVAVFDMTREDTFNEAISYIDIYKEHCGVSSPIIIMAGNKLDLNNDPLEMSKKLEWANSKDYHIIFTSAATGVGIDELINELTELLDPVSICKDKDDQENHVEITICEATTKKKKCC